MNNDNNDNVDENEQVSMKILLIGFDFWSDMWDIFRTKKKFLNNTITMFAMI